MLRRRFIKGSAILGAAATVPNWLRAASGMWGEGGERKVAQVLECQRTMVQNVPVLRGFAGDHTDLVSPFVMRKSMLLCSRAVILASPTNHMWLLSCLM